MAENGNDSVLYEQDGPVVTITMNRPDRRNALNDALSSGLAEALARAGEDDGVRAVVVTGAGRGFCAGADLENFSSGVMPEEARDLIIRLYQPLMTGVVSMKKPVIGAVNGVAAGAGAAVALACDLRVMADDASLLYAFINIGLAPDAGAGWFLARQVGYSRALELAIEGKRICAERCLELGLTNRVVPAGDLLEEARSWARELAGRPTLAIGQTKRALDYALTADLGDTIVREAELQMETFASHDFREGVAAFNEKRAPEFTGN